MACGRGVTGAAQGHGRCHSPVTSGRDSLGRVQARSSPGDRARTQASRQAAGHAWLGLEVNARGNAQSFCTIILHNHSHILPCCVFCPCWSACCFVYLYFLRYSLSLLSPSLPSSYHHGNRRHHHRRRIYILRILHAEGGGEGDR